MKLFRALLIALPVSLMMWAGIVWLVWPDPCEDCGPFIEDTRRVESRLHDEAVKAREAELRALRCEIAQLEEQAKTVERELGMISMMERK